VTDWPGFDLDLLHSSQIESNIRLELVTQHVSEMMSHQSARLAAIQEAQDRAARDADMGEILPDP
jgi:hypothetical protein